MTRRPTSRTTSRDSVKHSLGTHVLINVRPVNAVAVADQRPVRPLLGRCVGQPPRPRQWDTDHASVDQACRDDVVGRLDVVDSRFNT